MPRHMLFSNEMDSIVTKYFAGKAGWIQSEVNVDVRGLPEGMNVVYFYNREKNAIVIPSPLAVSNGEGDATEPSYQATTEAISKQIGNNHFSLCSSLLGKGSGERHYTAFFLYRENEENGKISIFDSKISEPNRFFSSSNAPTIFEKAWGYLTALFKAFGLWAFGIGKQIDSTFLGQKVTIHRLGTQPTLDAVSCGLHSTGAILSMVDLLDKGEYSTEQITSAVISSKNHDVVAEIILNDKEYGKEVPPVSPALTTVAKPDEYEKKRGTPYPDGSKTHHKVKKDQPEIIKNLAKLYGDFSEKLFTEKKHFSFEVTTVHDEDTILTVSAPYMHGPFHSQLKQNQSYDRINAFKQFLEINFNFMIEDIAVKSTYLSSEHTEMGHYSFKLNIGQQNDILAKDTIYEQAMDNFSRAWQVRNLLRQEISSWCSKQNKNDNDKDVRLLDFIKFVEEAPQFLKIVEKKDEVNVGLSLTGERWQIRAHNSGSNNDIAQQIEMIEMLNDYLCKKFHVDNSKLQIVLSQEVRPKNCLMTINLNVYPDAFDNVLNIVASDTSEIIESLKAL